LLSLDDAQANADPYQQTTDQSGRAILQNVPIGTIGFRVQSDEWQCDHSERFERIDLNKTLEASFTLKRIE
jgi:hypothetical protein